MHRSLPMILALAALAGCSGKAPDIRVENPRIVAGPGSAAAYFTLRNSGGADRLERVEARSAGTASLHQTSMAGGVMRMRALADGLEIGSGETLVLSPQATHVMIMPARPLIRGEKIALTLHFSRQGKIVIAAPVRLPIDEAR